MNLTLATDLTLADVLDIEPTNSSPATNRSECFDLPLESVEFNIQIVLIVLYSLTSIVGFVGNVTVIVVEVYSKEPTNHLRKFLINMAVSDVLMSVLCVPYTYTSVMLGRWVFPHWLCPAAQFIQLMSVSVTSFTLTVIGIERYLATLYPFSRSYRWINSHTNLMLCLSWVFALLYSSIWLTNTRCVAFTHHNQTYFQCRTVGLVGWQKKVIMTYNFVFTYAVPFLVIAFSYSAITRKLLADQMASNEAPLRRNIQITTTAKSIRMMFTVVALYGLCWTPIKWYQLGYEFVPSFFNYCSADRFHSIIRYYFFANWLAMSNTFVNPFVYSFMSQNFRKNLKRMCGSSDQRRRIKIDSQTCNTSV